MPFFPEQPAGIENLAWNTGTSGKTQGDKNDKIPAARAV